MEYDSVGSPIIRNFNPCNCGSSIGCKKCNPYSNLDCEKYEYVIYTDKGYILTTLSNLYSTCMERLQKQL